MKKIITILTIMLMLPMVALAQEEELELEVSAGITPCMPTLYQLDTWWDEQRLKMTSDVEEKARLRIEIAEERVAEMQKTAEKGKSVEFGIAQENRENEMKEVEKLADELDDEKRVKLQQRIQKHIQTLERVRAQVPENAQKGLDTAIANSNKVFERNQLKIQVINRQPISEIKDEIEMGNVQIKKTGGN